MTRNLFGFPKRLYQDSRRSFRVSEKTSVKWSVGGIGSGFGCVCDLSATGALIKAQHPLAEGTVISFDQGSGVLPPQGRVVWSKPRGMFRRGSLCGVEFIDAPSQVVDRLKKRIESRIASMDRKETVLAVVTIFLVVVMLSLGGLVLAQRASIARTVEQSNTLILSASGQQAMLYRGLIAQHKALEGLYSELQLEYTSARILLAQTENLLAETQRQYTQAQQEVVTLKTALAQAKADALGENVKMLMVQREGLRSDLQALQDEINALAAQDYVAWQNQAPGYSSQLDSLDARIKDLKYETLLARIGDHHKQIRAAKGRMSQLKQQAALARREAQRKHDEIALTQGNRGFIVKDGKAFTPPEAKTVGSPAKKVNIDVSFF